MTYGKDAKDLNAKRTRDCIHGLALGFCPIVNYVTFLIGSGSLIFDKIETLINKDLLTEKTPIL